VTHVRELFAVCMLRVCVRDVLAVCMLRVCVRDLFAVFRSLCVCCECVRVIVSLCFARCAYAACVCVYLLAVFRLLVISLVLVFTMNNEGFWLLYELVLVEFLMLGRSGGRECWTSQDERLQVLG